MLFTGFFGLGFALSAAAVVVDVVARDVGLFRDAFLLLAALFTGAVWGFGLKTAWEHVRARPRIVMYFREQIRQPPLDDFSLRSGFALAAVLPELDACAAAAGVEPLGAFGFADDQFGETVKWHDPATALRTVQRLVSSERATAVLSGLVLEELTTVTEALALATSSGNGFALLVRVGTDSWQGLYGHGRVGRFW